MKRMMQVGTAAAAALSATAAAAAQIAPPATGSLRSGNLWEAMLSTVVFSLLGIVLAIVGFKLFDLAIRFDMEKEICEKSNLAVAILASAVVLGTCIIVAVVVLS